MEDKLKKILSKERFDHCIRTMEMAKKLCDIHNISKKAITAALLHDCAKELSLEEMKKLVSTDYADDIDGYYEKNILHGFAGSKLCEIEFDIHDEEILSAIRYHTIGKINMTEIEKVVYLSDAIELGRNYENVDKIRELAYISLDDALLLELDFKIKNLIDRGLEIHKNSILLRNSLIKRRKK